MIGQSGQLPAAEADQRDRRNPLFLRAATSIHDAQLVVDHCFELMVA